MKKFNLVSIVTALAMMSAPVSSLAAAGDVAVTTDNPAAQRIFINNYDEGWGSGVANHNGWITGNFYVNTAGNGGNSQVQQKPNAAEGDKYMPILYGGSGGFIRLDNQNNADKPMLDAGWYRIDFDVAGANTAKASTDLYAEIVKSENVITLQNQGLTDTTYANNTLGQPIGWIYSGTAGKYGITTTNINDGMRTVSMFFKATGSDYYALHLVDYSVKAGLCVDNVALYKVGDASLAAPTMGVVGIEDLAGKKVTFTSKIKNNTEINQNAILIHSVYNEKNELVDVNFAKFSEEDENPITANNSSFANITLDFTQAADTSKYTVKTYLWDNLSSIAPYCDALDTVDRVVKKWDFEDGSTMGWKAGVGVTVENTSESVFGGTKGLKVTLPATEGFAQSNYNDFYLYSDELSSLYSKYGDGQYELFINVRYVGGAMGKYDVNIAGYDPYNGGKFGPITDGGHNVYACTPSTQIGKTNTGIGTWFWYDSNDIQSEGTKWQSSSNATNLLDIKEGNNGDLGNWPRRFVFQFRDYSNEASTIYIDEIILKKVN